MQATTSTASVRQRDDTALALFLVCATSFLGPFSQTIYSPSIVALRETFHTTNVMAGATIAVFAIALAVGQLAYGPLVDRYSGRNLLIGGVALYAVGSVLCFFAPTVELFILARAVQSIGIAAGLVVGGALISDRFPPERRGAAMSRLQIANATGAASGPVLGGALAFLVVWQSNFLALAVVGAVITYALVRWLPPIESHGQPITLRAIGEALARPATFGVVFAGFGLYFAHFSFVANAPVLFREKFGVPEPLIGGVLLGHAFGVIAGSTIGGRLSDRHGRRPAVLLGAFGVLFVCALFALFAALGTGPFGALLLAAIEAAFGFAMGFGIPSHMALMVEWLPRFRGSAVATYVSFRYLGAAIGPMVGGLLIDRATIWMPWVAGSLVLLAAAVLATFVVRPAPVPQVSIA